MSAYTKDADTRQWRQKLGDALDGSGEISTCLTLFSTFDSWNSEYAAHAPHKLSVPSTGVSDGTGVGDTFHLELAVTRHLVVELWSDEAISLVGQDGRLAATELMVRISKGSLRHSPLSAPEQRRLATLLTNLGRELRPSTGLVEEFYQEGPAGAAEPIADPPRAEEVRQDPQTTEGTEGSTRPPDEGAESDLTDGDAENLLAERRRDRLDRRSRSGARASNPEEGSARRDADAAISLVRDALRGSGTGQRTPPFAPPPTLGGPPAPPLYTVRGRPPRPPGMQEDKYDDDQYRNSKDHELVYKLRDTLMSDVSFVHCHFPKPTKTVFEVDSLREFPPVGSMHATALGEIQRWMAGQLEIFVDLRDHILRAADADCGQAWAPLKDSMGLGVLDEGLTDVLAEGTHIALHPVLQMYGLTPVGDLMMALIRARFQPTLTEATQALIAAAHGFRPVSNGKLDLAAAMKPIDEACKVQSLDKGYHDFNQLYRLVQESLGGTQEYSLVGVDHMGKELNWPRFVDSLYSKIASRGTVPYSLGDFLTLLKGLRQFASLQVRREMQGKAAMLSQAASASRIGTQGHMASVHSAQLPARPHWDTTVPLDALAGLMDVGPDGHVLLPEGPRASGLSCFLVAGDHARNPGPARTPCGRPGCSNSLLPHWAVCVQCGRLRPEAWECPACHLASVGDRCVNVFQGCPGLRPPQPALCAGQPWAVGIETRVRTAREAFLGRTEFRNERRAGERWTGQDGDSSTTRRPARFEHRDGGPHGKGGKGQGRAKGGSKGRSGPLQRSNDRALALRTVNFADSTHELPNLLDGLDLSLIHI